MREPPEGAGRRSPEAGKPRVLFVGKSESAESIVASLKRANVETFWVPSLELLQARLALEGLSTPHVVLVDLELDERTEDELVVFVRKSFPPAIVVILNAETHGDRAARLLVMGVSSLQKPVSPLVLAALALGRSRETKSATAAAPPLSPGSEAPGSGVGKLASLLEQYAARRALSKQQRVVLRHYLFGKNDKEIAWSCGCSETTVYEHWRRMAKKVGGMNKSCVIRDFHRFLDEQ